MPARVFAKRMRRFVRDRQGSISVITAVSMIALIGSAALTIDVGTIFNAKRKQQAATDIAAMVAAGNLPNAVQAAATALVDNGIASGAQTSIEYGAYVADPVLAPENRFRVVDMSAADAVRVSVAGTASLYFGSALAALTSPLKAQPSGVGIRTQATASVANFAAFAVGSRLASVNGGIMNTVLGKLLGVQLSLSVMDYQALSTAQVDLFQVSRALAAQSNAIGATFGQVTSGSARVVDVLSALLVSERLSGGGADTALNQIIQAKSGSADLISLASMIDFGPFASMQVGADLGMGYRVSALDAILDLARMSGQGRVVTVNLAGVVPSLADLQLLVAVGAPAAQSSYTKVGRAGAQVQTAQTRLLFTARLTALPPLLSLSLPLYIELASAKATLASLSCTPGGDTPSVMLGVQPSIVDAWIGSLANADFGDLAKAPSVTPVPVATVLGLAAISGSAHAAIANVAPAQLRFTSLDITNGTKRSTSTTDLSASLAKGLVGNLSLSLGPNSVAVPALASQAVTQGLSAAAPILDTVIDSVLATLGLRIGEADAWVTGVRCGGGVLVN